MGFIFVLDRLTGKPIFPIEERPVPASTIPGEAAWPTQPFPLKPPPLSRISLTPEDFTTVTPESHEFCAQEFGSVLQARIFKPESAKLGLLVPGNLGGATWSGASFDPTTGYLYVNVNEVPSVGLMQPQPESSPERYRRWTKWGAYMRYWDNNRYPCIQPPWGTLNAVDMNSGEIVWKVTLGAYDELLKRGIPPTGAPSLGGTIVTAGGLVFVAGTNDGRFRAFDSRDGKLLLETRLEASGHSTPLTYLGPKTGKQFVVITAGGGGKFSHQVADVLAAYSLPD
jgi:quinoprotein glucose dehydrogenase